MVKCWRQSSYVDTFSVPRQHEVAWFGVSQGTTLEAVGLNRKTVVFGVIAWDILYFRWSGEKNDRNGPYAFISRDALNLMGLPDSGLCPNGHKTYFRYWSVALLQMDFIFRLHILLNVVYSCVLKYCALNVLPLFAVIWSRHLIALLWFTHVNGMGQGKLFPTFLPN